MIGLEFVLDLGKLASILQWLGQSLCVIWKKLASISQSHILEKTSEMYDDSVH